MKTATNRYNIKIKRNGKTTLESYYGYTSRKAAEERAELWRKAGFQAEVIDGKK